MQTNVPHLNCLRCNHTWIPRQAEIRICPNCKSAYWDRPRTALSGAIISGNISPVSNVLGLSGEILSGGAP